MDPFLAKVKIANNQRTMENFSRRLLKLGEEYGEANQAYLSVTSESNGKNKSWSDVREELIDTLVVTMDLLLHEFPDQAEFSDEQKTSDLEAILDTKLKKWSRKQKKKTCSI